MCPCSHFKRDDVVSDVRGNGLPQLPQNLAVSIFWLRQTGQMGISFSPRERFTRRILPCLAAEQNQFRAESLVGGDIQATTLLYPIAYCAGVSSPFVSCGD